MSEHPEYKVVWSPEDGEWVATCSAYPSLSWLAADPASALNDLLALIEREFGVPEHLQGEGP